MADHDALSASHIQLTHSANAAGEEEISFLGLTSVLWKHRRFIVLTSLAAAAATLGIALVIPNTFIAEAVILPPQQGQSASASLLMSQLGGLSSLGAMSGLSLRSTTDLYLYIGILKGRTIADSLIQKFHLKSVYETKTLMDTRKRLARHTTIATNKDPLIHIRVEERDPILAADIANAYVDELFKQNEALALTEASQRRLFFEQRYSNEKKALAGAEVALRNVQQSTRLIVPSGQAEALLRTGAQLRSAVAERQAQLNAIKTFAAESNPAYRRLNEELSTLRKQLHQMESSSPETGGFELSVASLPQASLEYVRRFRELKYHEALYEMLAKQLEAARIDEAKSAPVIQVVDRALPSDNKSWPPRALIVIAVAILSAVCAGLWVLAIRDPRAANGTPASVSNPERNSSISRP